MNKFSEVLLELINILDGKEIEYALIGAVAMSVYTIPRTTLDIDIIAYITKIKFPYFLQELRKHISSIDEDKLKSEFEEGLMLSFEFKEVAVDIILPSIPFFYQVIKRANVYEFLEKKIKVATPEDIIICKLLSARETDIKDIELLKKANLNLDIKYIEECLEKLVGRGYHGFYEFKRLFKDKYI